MNDYLSKDALSGKEPDPDKPSRARVTIWIVVGAIGLYLVGSGVWGLIVNG